MRAMLLQAHVSVGVVGYPNTGKSSVETSGTQSVLDLKRFKMLEVWGWFGASGFRAQGSGFGVTTS